MYAVQLMDFPEEIIAAESPKKAKTLYIRNLQALLDRARYGQDGKALEQLGIHCRKLMGLYI